MIETRWHKDRFDADGYARFKADYEKTVPLAKAATPDDVAEVCVWLLEGGDVVTGESIFVDSGMHLGFGRGADNSPRTRPISEHVNTLVVSPTRAGSSHLLQAAHTRGIVKMGALARALHAHPDGLKACKGYVFL
jgi:hypothetical protein